MNKFYKKLSDSDVNDGLKELVNWNLSEGAISRTFNFTNYHQTISFVNQVADIANAINHHPDMNVSFKSCTVSFTTHAVEGISILDFISASRLDMLIESIS